MTCLHPLMSCRCCTCRMRAATASAALAAARRCAASGQTSRGKAAVEFLALVLLAGAVGAPLPGAAAELDLLAVGMRARVGEKRVLGEAQPESFRAYDLSAQFRLPWQHAWPSGWHLGSRLITTAGLMRGAGKTALVVSATPVAVLSSASARTSVDIGLGLALLSEHRFAQQDYGGPLQGTLTFGVTLPLGRQLGLGYRFVHYSDAGAYGRGTIGADFHMIELVHRF
ncbi:MAG: hypothetical protein C0505_19380 [Leptothrix sp. (in: Bacteria)]|nr:hypothetical protein [Leptothrix sp. (in: b-proteobacteria)]